jgi:hypothetical protein
VHRLGIVMAVIGVALLAGAVMIYRSAQRREPDAIAPAPMARADAPAPPPTPAAPTPAAAEPAPPATITPRPGPEARAATPPASATRPAPVASAGTLTVTADVTGAQVFLDRQFIGTAPVTAPDITPGSHQLNVSAPGFDPIVQTIDVAPGPREIAVRFREVRLNLTLDVVHKHRLGSCRGQLVATPQGLRYETPDKDDAFSTDLLELETFQVDYLARILRVQPRRGRRYDFTDPQDNADRLFVFHRDVEKARQQLRRGDTP